MTGFQAASSSGKIRGCYIASSWPLRISRESRSTLKEQKIAVPAAQW
jgi:hypothetical protein